MKHVITVGKQDITLTHDEAREMYLQLKELFGSVQEKSDWEKERERMLEYLKPRLYKQSPFDDRPIWLVDYEKLPRFEYEIATGTEFRLPDVQPIS